MQNGLAAHFTGTVHVDCATEGGQFFVNPMSAKSGVLKHPDGSHRLMYTVEAPESWAEDFDEGQLVNGKAEVTLDPDFAPLIHTEDYHIFLTTYGPSQGLDVAKPKTDHKAEWLAKFAIPQVTYPDPATLPKPAPSK